MIKMQIFATSEKVEPNKKNVNGLNSSTVKRWTVPVTRQPLHPELPESGRDLLYQIHTLTEALYTL
jgi:hypothetical protein